jgi:integrase
MTNKNVSLMEFQTSNAKISCLLHVRRVKQGTPSTHPIVGDELRALRRLQREQEPKSPFVFTSERGTPLTTAGFARMIERAGIEAKFGFKPHPHMLRHACGYALANRGTIPGHCKPTWVIKTSIIRFAILSYRRPGSRTFGGNNNLRMAKA